MILWSACPPWPSDQPGAAGDRGDYAAKLHHVRGHDPTARYDERARRLMTTPGVGVLVALTFVAAVDDPERFRSSRDVGPHFGLTPRKYQSGETDYTGRISKAGDRSVRTALYEAANIILTRPVKDSDLKIWALAVARRAGMRKAKVALARKLAVVLHRMLRDKTSFVAYRSAPLTAAA